MLMSVPAPAPSETSADPDVVRQHLGSPSCTVRVRRARADLEAQCACCCPCCPVDAWPKTAWPSIPFLPSSSARGPCSLGCCSVETAPFSTSPPIRPQLRPRPRGKDLVGLRLGRHMGMSDTFPAACPARGASEKSRPRDTVGLLLSLLPYTARTKRSWACSHLLPPSLWQSALPSRLLQCRGSPCQHLPSN